MSRGTETTCGSRERLASATAAKHWAALDAPRGRLPSATAAPHWAALEVADVCEENRVVEEDKDCDENTPVDDVVKSCADEVVDALEANFCVVPGVDQAEANACVEPRADDKVAAASMKYPGSMHSALLQVLKLKLCITIASSSACSFLLSTGFRSVPVLST